MVIDTGKQKYTYWHKILKSTYPEWSVGNIIGLNRRESKLHLFNDKNPNNIKGFAVKMT